MNSLKKTFLPLLISAATLVVGFWLLEKNYQHELQKMGWLPTNKLNLYPYGRRLSGYTVTENTPNFHLNAYDDKFLPVAFETDSYGFKTDGTILQKTKDRNTIRIFITGGSTAWGSIESRKIMRDTTYPEGNYCYAATIAGKLKKLLQTEYPELKFEVIDAAVVHFLFHQSFALYYEKLHDFNPDIVVNIDGHNDLGDVLEAENHGDPYKAGSTQMEEELQLATTARLPQWPYTLVYYDFKYIRQHGNNQNSRKPALSVSNDVTVIKHEPDHKSYELIKPNLIISKKLLWLIDSYERQLRADGVYSIFCLQPMLRRRIYQKELSVTEQRFRTFLERVTIGDTLNLKANPGEFGKLFNDQQLADQMGVDKYWVNVLIQEYMFNDFSNVFDSIVTVNGGTYLDINKAMTGLGGDKEFYVDYCHLTPFGNQFVAELLLKKVALYIAQKRTVNSRL